MSFEFSIRDAVLQPTDGQKFADSVKKAGKPPQVADKVIQMLKVEISDKNFNFVAGSLRFFSKDELAAVQEKIGALKAQGNGKKIEQLFKKAIDHTNDPDIKFALQKIYGAFTAQPALSHYPQATKPRKAPKPDNEMEQLVSGMAKLQVFDSAATIQTLKVLERIDTLDRKKLVALAGDDRAGIEKFLSDNGEVILVAVATSKMMAAIQASTKPGAAALAAELKATMAKLNADTLPESELLPLFLVLCEQLAKAEKLLK